MERINVAITESIYNWRVLFIILIIAVTGLFCDIGSHQQLPDCDIVEDIRAKSEPNSSLLLVSTLDGKLTALTTEEGTWIWEINTGPGALLASTIKQLQMSQDGQWVRIVHSLEGELFTLGEDSIHSLPMRVDDILSSSLKLTDDTVITGGKESRTFGVSPSSGQIRYSCTLADCRNNYGELEGEEPVLVVQRKVQTVRAISPLTGLEKWNFSVSNHEILLVGTVPSGCRTESESSQRDAVATSVQFLAHDGVVVGLHPSNPEDLIWKRKFDSPIAHAWILEDGALTSLDLFENSYLTAMIGEDGQNHDVKPAVYVGSYQDLLYLQRGHHVHDQDVLYKQNLVTDMAGHFTKVAWKPFFVAMKFESMLLVKENEPRKETTALVIREAQDVLVVEDSGFYLFAIPPSERDTKIRDFFKNVGCDHKSIWHDLFSNKKTAISILPNNSYPFGAKIPIYNTSGINDAILNDSLTMSLWHWWKEIMFISVTFAVFVNVVIFKAVMRRLRQKIKEESASDGTNCTVSGSETPTPDAEIETKVTSNGNPTCVMMDANFESRYLTDFEHIQRLGKGGFGLVVEARNKIDDCHYAIKRICLPNRDEARKKVMREVKALAMLDHVGIVRYYNAWLECPPAGWQESKDQQIEKEDTSTQTSLSHGKLKSTVDTVSSFEGSRKGITSMTYSDDRIRNSNEESGSFSCDSFRRYEKSRDRSTDGKDSFIIFQDSGCGEKLEEREEEALRPTTLGPLASEGQGPPAKVYLYIQMQLCRKESLRDWLVANSPCRDKRVLLDMFEQIVCAVEYVHSQGLMHRDLKPSNIFFAIDGTVKVGDFGLVTAMPEGIESPIESPMSSLDSQRESLNHTDQVGTQLYMSPEQIYRLPYDQKVDIYSLGLIFFEMLIPFSTQMERMKVLTNARQNIFPEQFAKIHSDECAMVRQLLAFDAELRPSANDIMEDPLLENIHSTHEMTLKNRKRSRTVSRTCSTSSSGSGGAESPL